MQRASRERIQIPFGVGICGYVAQTKETINLSNAYEVIVFLLLNVTEPIEIVVYTYLYD